MKGISHFAVGVSLASFFPAAVEAGARGDPLCFVLGGVCGLLPDTLDFKFYRSLYRHDVEAVLDPLRPDPSHAAAAVAWAVNRAAATRRTVRVKLNAVRLGPDAWQSYTVRFDVQRGAVEAALGPVVDTGGSPDPDALPPDARPATVRVAAPVRLEYQAQTRVDIFDGALFGMEPQADGCVVPHFIPWHREWSHSLAVAAAVGAGCAVLWGGTAGWVAFAGFAAHVLVDQAGYMGSNLFFPFTRRRTPGLHLVHSASPIANAMAVWVACLLTFWNLYAARPSADRSVGLVRLLLYGAGVPLAAALLMRLYNRRHGG